MERSLNYAYNYAYIDLDTNMCIEVTSTTAPIEGVDNIVEIPVNDGNYLLKYYNWDDGKFYYDAEYTSEFVSSML